MGNILQIDAELKNLIVRNEVDDCPLKIGDSILKIENKKINTFEDFNYILSTLDKSKDILVLIRRENSNPRGRMRDCVRADCFLSRQRIGPAERIGLLAPLDAGEGVVELLGQRADLAVGDVGDLVHPLQFLDRETTAAVPVPKTSSSLPSSAAFMMSAMASLPSMTS